MTNFKQICTKIIGIGRNYAKHAKELGNAVPTAPVIFMKPPTAFITSGQSIRIPYGCQNLHHEIELGVVIGTKCANVSKEHANDVISGYCLALDMTARDLQEEAKKKQLPWVIAKGFDTSCPVSEFIDKKLISDVCGINLELSVNGQVRQSGKPDCMIFDIPTLIEYCSKYFTLNPGDLILTGTPEGVSQVVRKEVLISKLWTDDGQVSIEMINDVRDTDCKLFDAIQS